MISVYRFGPGQHMYYPQIFFCFRLSLDLQDQKIIFGNKETKFEIDQFKKKCLLEGLDDIALSLEKKKEIELFEQKLKTNRPWIFND